MCIYLGEAEGLTYKKQEHIFPAGLGGVRTLPRGYVSDQANEAFSRLEGELMHASPIALDRYFSGPGDRRGKDSQSYVTVGRCDDGQLALSYLSMGVPRLIPQALIYSQLRAELSFPDDGADAALAAEGLMDRLRGFTPGSRFVFLPCPDMEPGDMIVGAHDGKFFVSCRGERPDAGSVHTAIGRLLGGFEPVETKRESRRITQRHTLVENGDIARAYAKTAMNALARLRGAEYAKRREFDAIRRWIAAGEGGENFNFLPSISDGREPLLPAMPDGAHFCVFAQVDGAIQALVCFYGKYVRRFTLGKAEGAADFRNPNAYICDWKNKREYTLGEYIERLIEDMRAARGRE